MPRRLRQKTPSARAGFASTPGLQALHDEALWELTALSEDARRKHVHWVHVRTHDSTQVQPDAFSREAIYIHLVMFGQILFGERSIIILVHIPWWPSFAQFYLENGRQQFLYIVFDAKAVALKKTGTLNTARKKLRTIHASKQFSKTFSSIDMQCVVEKSESRKCRCHLSVCLLSLRLLGHDSLVIA